MAAVLGRQLPFEIRTSRDSSQFFRVNGLVPLLCVEDDEFEVMTLSDGTKCLDNHETLSLAPKNFQTRWFRWRDWVRIFGLRDGHAFQKFLLKKIELKTHSQAIIILGLRIVMPQTMATLSVLTPATCKVKEWNIW